MSLLAVSALSEYLCYGSMAIRIFLLLLVRGLYMSESDLYRRIKTVTWVNQFDLTDQITVIGNEMCV